MYRYMKHLPTGTIHSYEPAWLRGDDHGFVECDENGVILQDAIEGEATVVEETATAKRGKKKAAAVVEDDLDAALAEDASRGL